MKGASIDFIHEPYQNKFPNNYNFTKEEKGYIDKEIEKFLSQKIIVPCEHESGEFISNIFTRPKKDGSLRIILNLKPLNEFIRYEKFKMQTIQTCINLMSEGCYMASIDLKNAYYSIPMDEKVTKFLKFEWNGQLYKFQALVMGLSSAPRLFTKVMKPVFSHLRRQGLISSNYLDDSYLQGYTFEQCKHNVVATLDLMKRVGFTPHEDKSVVIPTQVIEHLGFVLNSKDMTVSINHAKFVKLKTLALQVLQQHSCTIRVVAKLIGIMVSCCTGVEFGELYCKTLEFEKIAALKSSRGNYDGLMVISPEGRHDITWWINHALINKKKISHGVPSHVLKTDASNEGWGAIFENNIANGQWSEEEKAEHINVKELKAVYNGLLALCSHIKHTHIKLYMDNMTAVAYIRKMGGTHSVKCNAVARLIWEWAIKTDNYLLPAHIPGVDNVEADFASRIFDNTTEWMLNKQVFADVTKVFGMPEIDLFASKLNTQLKRYVSWYPDRKAVAIDAFTRFWGNEFVYVFSPFSLILDILNKIKEEKAKALVIVPYWPTQTWFPVLVRMLINFPLMLPRMKNLLTLPFDSSQTHPLQPKMNMMACLLSGKDSSVQEFQHGLKTSCLNPGEQALKNNMPRISKNGLCLQIDNLLIPCNHL